MKIRLLVNLFFITTFTFGQKIQDDSYLDEAFFKFKNSLVQSIIDKDKVAFSTHLAEKVYTPKDLCDSPICRKEEVMNYFFSEGDDTFWKELLMLFRFGFLRQKSEYSTIIEKVDENIVFKAPSFTKNLDIENELLILGENVNIRSKPSLNSNIIKTVSYEIFKCDCGLGKPITTKDNIVWIEIKLGNGKVGYVAEKFTSSYYLKEIEIGKINGEWKIVAIVEPWGC
ncbi:SH3 domain-containing protein [Aureivirga marina]|uniref:SH3 domain-containing protein n=1 Tax=Aureivirga marina TaxID=1182451 RepID=UPI0018CB0E13|nr:SH3 domain-containing protein [Aureivirga marina]